MKIIICKKCVITSLKPNIRFLKNGICVPCANYEIRKFFEQKENFKRSREKFKRVIYNNRNNKKYDVIIPVSGGKDSLFQVIKTKEFTQKILAVCVDFGLRTEIGEKNLNLITNKLNVDLIKYSFNKKTIKKLALYSFKNFGDPDLFNHILLYNLPRIIAKDLGIKTIIFGEDPRIMSSSVRLTKKINKNKFFLDKNYFDKFVNHSNINTNNILKKLNIPIHERIYFQYKNISSIKVIFLGNFFKWDSNQNFKLAKSIGFKTSRKTEGTYRNFVNVDEDWNRIHHYLKLLKFGYGRTTDHACEDIRLGVLKREKALKLIKKYEYQKLSKYYLDRLSEYLEISNTNIIKILEKFRNKKIWKKNKKKWLPIFLKSYNY